MFSPINPSYVRTEVIPTSQPNVYPISVTTGERTVLMPSVITETITTPSPPSVADLNRKFESYENLATRVNSVEKLVLSSVDKSAQDFRAMRDSTNMNEQHRATNHSRLEYLERLIDSHMAQWKAERAADAERVSKIDARVVDFARTISRVDAFDSQLGEFGRINLRVDELADKLGSALVQNSQMMQLNTTAEIKLNALESTCKEMQAQMGRDVKGRIETIEQQLGLKQGRIDNIELQMGRDVKARIESIEQLFGSEVKLRMDEMKARIEALEQVFGRDVKARIENIEKYVSQSEKRQEKTLKELKDAAVALRSRLNHLEGLLAENVDNQESLRSAVQDLQQGVDKFDALHKLTGHHATLLERVEFVERTLGETAGKHKEHASSLEQRLEYLENVLGDDADKHAAIDALHGKFDHQLSHHANVATRIDFVESYLGVDADKTDGADAKTTVEQRLKSLEEGSTLTGRLDSPLRRGPTRTPPVSIISPSVPVSGLRLNLLQCSPQVAVPSRVPGSLAGVQMRTRACSPGAQKRDLSPLPLSATLPFSFSSSCL